jgi:hypothetical protein
VADVKDAITWMPWWESDFLGRGFAYR